MTLADVVMITALAFIGGLLLGFLLLLLRGANVTSRPLRALRRRLLGRAWQPVLMEPVEYRNQELRDFRRKTPSSATH